MKRIQFLTVILFSVFLNACGQASSPGDDETPASPTTADSDYMAAGPPRRSCMGMWQQMGLRLSEPDFMTMISAPQLGHL